MGFTYKRINAASTGGSGGSGASYFENFTSGSWTGPTSGYYTYTVLAANHGKGTAPGVEVYLESASNYDQIEVDRVRVNASGDVEIRVPEVPDLRFTGRILILE